MQTIREYNAKELIIAIIDNFSSHKAKKTIEFTKSRNILLLFLLPYSPDLNPIKQIWKS
ncbi:MAG: IS630 family transposase, partial [Candidatus Aenigmarchaeota archaeon ex4484_52]